MSPDYPIVQITQLFVLVGGLAAIAWHHHRLGERGVCQMFLATACLMCVLSMGATVHKHCVKAKPDGTPVSTVRLTDLTHAHTYCGLGCGGSR